MPLLSSDQVAAWTEYNAAPWGRLRLDLIWALLERHVPLPPGRVLDVGCGLGETAVRLARAGSDVVAADAAEAMIAAAQERAVDASVRWLVADLDTVAAELADERFDLVICHNVLGYVADPAAACLALARLLDDGGRLSLGVGNRLAEPLRLALRRRDLGAALAAVETGARSRRGETLDAELGLTDFDEVGGWLAAAGLHVEATAGIRIVNDYLADDELKRSDDGYAALLRLELALCEREPYKRVAPLLHVLARRD